MKNIVILISGRGSNMQAIVNCAREQGWPAKIAAVISNKANAEGLAFASRAGIPTAVVANADYPDRQSFDEALSKVIDGYRPDLVVLAGFMRILTPSFVDHFAGRLLNIHPSLLPSFPGLHTHERALEAGVKFHGVTVHFVTADLDHGPIVDQAVVPVLQDDTESTLAARVLKEEHVIYPRAVLRFVEGRLRIDGHRVHVLNQAGSIESEGAV